MPFVHHRLANGLQIVVEENRDALSAAVAFYVRTGARDEPAEWAGVSHFLEHMAFKGNDRLSAEDINRQFDALGAQFNAYTTEEVTAYYAAVLPEAVTATVDLLAVLLRPALRDSDFELERTVILNEISDYADSPMWNAYDRVMHRFFGSHPLGHTVLGSRESVGGLQVDQMRRYHQARYQPANMVLIATGHVDTAVLIAQAERLTAGWPSAPVVPRPVERPTPLGSELLVRPNFAQQVLFLVAPAPASTDPRRIAAELLTTIVGDDTGSRFYFELAEPGLVESVDMSYNEYDGAGILMVTAAAEPTQMAEALAVIRQVLEQLQQEGVTEEELTMARTKVASRFSMAAEIPSNRLPSLAYNWIYRGNYLSVNEELALVEAVTLEDVHQVLAAFPPLQATAVSLGPLPSLPGL